MNLEEIDKWLKDEEGISYTELGNEFNQAVEKYSKYAKEVKRLNNIIEHIENICKSSISSVDKILLDEKEIKIKNGILQNRNNYQIVRLKAYKTKSKEILGRIKELKGSDKE